MIDGGSAESFLPAFDERFYEIVRLSLVVSCSATVLAGVIGLPFGAGLALLRFPDRTLAWLVRRISEVQAGQSS